MTYTEYKRFDKEIEKIVSKLRELENPEINRLANEMLDASWEICGELLRREQG